MKTRSGARQGRIASVLCTGGLLLYGLIGGALADESAAKLPPVAKSGLYFPDRDLRLNRQGRVLVEFHVLKAGKVVDANVISQEPADFADKRWLVDQLRGVSFNVPADWLSSGGEGQLFQLSLLYVLSNCSKCQEVKHFDVANAMTITGTAVPRPGNG